MANLRATKPPKKSCVTCPRAMPSERAVLAHDAHTAVQHHRHQEARLALGEARTPATAETRSSRRHDSISSARPPVRPRPRPRARLTSRPAWHRRHRSDVKPALHLRRGVRAAVVRGHDLDVLDLALAVRALAFEAQVRKLDVVVDHGQLVFTRPPGTSSRPRCGRPPPSRRPRFGSWRNALILALQLLLEDDLRTRTPRSPSGAAASR